MIRVQNLSLAVLCLFCLSSCDLDFTEEKFVDEDSIRAHFNTGATFVHIEAASRLLDAINGEIPDGVVLTENGRVVTAVVDADYDSNGSRETSVIGGVTFPNDNMSFDNGAEVRIDEVTGNQIDGSLTATATTTTSGDVTIDGSGEFTGDAEKPVDVEVDLVVTPSTGMILGTVDIDTGDLSATAFYEDNGQGGFRVRVVGPDFEFTAY
ncbi:MAG: hypothetical protein HKN43_13225 [Rhodothermales bacterium]|nr:hypothetical protein [Rhodothermales bacterium]